MAYTKHTWSSGETITDTLLNNIETGVEANDKAFDNKADKSAIADMLTNAKAESTYAKKTEISSLATKSELGGKAKKGTNISTPDATDSASGETVNPAEFKKAVALVNECKKQLNAMNA